MGSWDGLKNIEKQKCIILYIYSILKLVAKWVTLLPYQEGSIL